MTEIQILFFLIGMAASFMAGRYFEKEVARQFIHDTNFKIMATNKGNREEISSFVASTALILDIYYNDDLIVRSARKAAMTKKQKSQTEN